MRSDTIEASVDASRTRRARNVDSVPGRVAVGADGLLVEVHHDPDNALSDGMQSILPEEFAELTAEMKQIAGVLHRIVN